MNTKISVIIPIYKAEKYLRACLDSVLNQNLDSFEIIAVNDGSPDACGDILSEYSKKYSNLKVITQENAGLGGARNTGILSAKGKYLLFLDSDDTLCGGALSFLYDTAEKYDGDIVSFGINYITEANDVILTYKATPFGVKCMAPYEYLLEFANNSYACNKLYKAELFKDNNVSFPQRAWYEDLATVPKLILNCKNIVLTDKIFYNYLQRSDSIMHVSNQDRNIEMIDAVDGVINYYKSKNCFEQYFDILEYMAILHLLVLATNRVAGTDPKHVLLKKFHQYTKSNFPNFKKNKNISISLPVRRKFIYAFSKRKMYRCLYLLNKINNIR